MPIKSWKLLVVGLAVWLGKWSSPSESQRAQADGRNIRIEFNEMLHSRVVAKFEGREIAIGNFPGTGMDHFETLRADLPVWARATSPAQKPAAGCPRSRRFCETWELTA